MSRCPWAHLLLLLVLQVPSEDTVLCTASIYAKEMKAAGHDRQLLQDSLAPLVRCRHLSKFWLQALLLSDNAEEQPISYGQATDVTLTLTKLLRQLKHMLLLQQAAKGPRLTAAFVSAGVPDAPASWLLPARPGRRLNSTAHNEWAVDVADITAAAQKAARKQKQVYVRSGLLSALVMGVAWKIMLVCKPAEDRQNVVRVRRLLPTCQQEPPAAPPTALISPGRGRPTDSNSSWSVPRLAVASALQVSGQHLAGQTHHT